MCAARPRFRVGVEDQIQALISDHKNLDADIFHAAGECSYGFLRHGRLSHHAVSPAQGKNLLTKPASGGGRRTTEWLIVYGMPCGGKNYD